LTHSTISEMKFPSAARTVCLLLVALFCIETFIMYLLPVILPMQAPYVENLVDATLLTILSAPLLYRYIFKPFRDIAAVQHSLSESIMSHVVDGVVVLDHELCISSFNSAAEKIFGCQASHIAGAKATTILGNDIVELCQAASGSAPVDSAREVMATRCDGSRIPVELSLSPIRIAGRSMWLGIIRDISARKRDEATLKQTLSLLSATVESTGDGIMVRDLDGRVVLCNRRFGELWRIPKELLEMRNEKVLRAFVLEQLKDPQSFLELTEGQYLDHAPESRDILHFKDGRMFERYSAPQVVDDRVVGRVICYNDVTEQRNLEHQLRHAQKMEALGTLAGGVAHDFNNILTVIMGFCNLTSARLEPASPLKHNLHQIMIASERALTLTNSLLAYSRKQPINPVPLDLNARVAKIEKFLSRLIGEDVELVTALCREKITVMADGGQLEQVLMNLAANARDAMSKKGCLIIGTHKMKIDEEFVRLHGYGRPGAFAVLSVSDTGEGMDEETREKIFEPFFTTKEVGRGTGLGLSIVYGIVKQHKGYINVYSELGKGTTFNIYLPVTQAAEENPLAVQQEIMGGTETVLLAEDDDGVRALVKSVLTTSGYQVIEACDGRDAVKKFLERRDDIELLVLDVVMPNRNGKEAYEEIRALKPDVKALFISGYTADIVDKNGLGHAGVDLIMKPLLPNQLLQKVREMLDQG
jgi:two-component system, cell cycle sensor histidine kinase and response regulator CckA